MHRRRSLSWAAITAAAAWPTRAELGRQSSTNAQVAATLETVLEAAKLHDVDPAACFAAAVVAADRREGLLPGDYAATAAR